MTLQNTETADKIKAHHLQMTSKLNGLVNEFINIGVRDQSHTGSTSSCRDDELTEHPETANRFSELFEQIVEFLNCELKPHAMAEELYLYPITNDFKHSSDLISSMIDDHRQFETLIESLTTKTLKKQSDIILLSTCYSINKLFDLHAEKENKYIVEAISNNDSVDLAHVLNDMHDYVSNLSNKLTDNRLDVRTLAPAFRHETIFTKFEELQNGDLFVLINDHDPKPLYYQFKAEYADQFEWEYLMSGPSTWQVKIKKVG